ncbi:MAG: ABC transporter ATP-binding protein [Betaproteobacteria bacterium]|nr:MAG: ABC transporter ATP-binding protein [Betaproteobacteria bacterium]
MAALLEVENLRVDIPTPSGLLHAVRGVDLRLDRGETLSLVGESGCGKSLTALALMGLLPAAAQRSAQRLRFGGQDLVALPERAMSDLRGDRMAMVFQEPMTSLNPAYTVGNQLEEALLRHRRLPRSKARERAVLLLDRVGITAAGSRLSQYPHQLSGGLRQRVMIAMALMCGPELIVADEPTTALDVTVQAQILHLLKELQREFAMALILITHDLGIVARVADRVAVMYAGEVVESAPVKALFQAPRHPYTRGLMRCIPVPGRTQPGEKLGVIAGLVPTPIGELAGCQFRNRCEYARPDCARPGPEFRRVDAGHEVRCVLAA